MHLQFLLTVKYDSLMISFQSFYLFSLSPWWLSWKTLQVPPCGRRTLRLKMLFT